MFLLEDGRGGDFDTIGENLTSWKVIAVCENGNRQIAAKCFAWEDASEEELLELTKQATLKIIEAMKGGGKNDK